MRFRWAALWLSAVACGCGSSDGSGTDARPPDGQAPQFSGAASATGLSSAIRIEWEPAGDNITPDTDIVYLVHEADAPGGQDLSAPTYTTLPGAGSYTAAPLPVSATRYYIVRARDEAGNTDDNTVEISATTLDTADETAPVFDGLATATTAGPNSVQLSWSAASDDVSPPELITYRAYAATAAGAQDFGSPIDQSDPGATELVVTGLSAETTYHFVVRAVDANGNEETNTVERSAATAAAATLSGDVQPILSASCTSSACHDGIAPAQGLDLRPGRAHGELVGVPAAQCASRLRVAPGDPGASYLVDKLRGTNLCSGTVMPKAGSPLPEAEIQVIESWIAGGALDN